MTAAARPIARPDAPPPTHDFLDAKHPIYVAHQAAWERDERRLAGGDEVLDELVQFAGEADASFEARKRTASYVPLPALHLSRVVGHISQHRPVPGKGMSFGSLGEVRERSVTTGPLSRADRLWYSVDSTGMDGTMWPAYFDALQERAGAVPRWLLCEMPPAPEGRRPSEQDEAAGFRPYAVEFSALDVPFWHFRRGEPQMVIIRVADSELRLVGSTLTGPGKQGYYLLVRKGFTGLGEAFAGGGWWLYDSDKRLQSTGDWEKTSGVIPITLVVGKTSRGTTKRPALSEPLTMELGQIAVALMNIASARYYDAWDACASRLYFLGADPDAMQAVKSQVDARSMMIGVPPVASASSAGQERIVDIYDGSMGTVPAEVMDKLTTSLLDQAREIMLRQLTSTADSSGASKEAGFSEASEPLLVRLAITREQTEASFMYFAAQRWGVKPDGFVSFPREFDLLSERDAVDRFMKTLQQSSLRSPTLEAKLVLRAASEDGLIADEEESAIVQAELAASAGQSVRDNANADSLLSAFDQAAG